MMGSITDFDAPRAAVVDPVTDSLELLQERRSTPALLSDTDVSEEIFELPGFEVLDEELTAPVIPVQADEFRCTGCFLVLHRTMLALGRDGDHGMCRDCA